MWLKKPSTLRLEKRLYEIESSGDASMLPSDKKAQMKERLMASITQAPELSLEHTPASQTLMQRFKEVALQVVPREFFRLVLKEKLITLTEVNARVSLRRDFRRVFFSRQLAASLAIFVFVATVLFNFTLSVQQAHASYATLLEEVYGPVVVLRDGKEELAQAGFILQGEDIVRTGSSGRVVIRFLDQSVTRLDENTEVKISRLFINPRNKAETVVELVLSKGRLWARVINLIDDLSRFQVKAESAVAVATKKAAFNVVVEPKKNAKVSAIAHGVDLVVVTDKNVVETTLGKGYSAEIRDVAASSRPVIRHENPSKSGQEWIASNLEKDRVYIQQVKKEVEEGFQNNSSLLPGNPLYAVKELSHSTQIALTIDEVARQRKILSAAQQKLTEAQMVITKGDVGKAQALLNEFKADLGAVGEWTRRYQTAYPAETLEVVTRIHELLSGSQKQLALMLPEDTLYLVKEAVEETQVLVAADAQQKTEVKLAQAGTKLLEAQELIDQGDSVAAQKQVDKYTRALTQVVSEVKQLSASEDKENAVSALLDGKLEDLKVLDTIGNSPEPSGESPALSVSSAEATQEPATVDATSSVAADGPVAEGAELEKSETTEKEPASLEQSIFHAKTETLMKLAEAVIEVQKNQINPVVLKKLQQIRNIDLNGKPFINLQLNRDHVTIKRDDTVISVPRLGERPAAPSVPEEEATTTPAIEPVKQPDPVVTPPSIGDLKTPESLPVQP